MTETRTAVIAVGGNALSPPGEHSTIADQFRHTRDSLGPIVDLVLDGWRVVVVHGNGPQVGDELVRNEKARSEVSPLPLGVLVAGPFAKSFSTEVLLVGAIWALVLALFAYPLNQRNDHIVMNIVNLAHGSFVLVGAYIAWKLNTEMGLDPYLGAIVAAVVQFFKRRRGSDLDDTEWQELPPPAGG